MCWVDAPAMAAKMIMDIGSDVLKSGRDIKLTGSTEVNFCCNDMPLDRLAAFLKLVYPEGANRDVRHRGQDLHQDSHGDAR